MNKTLKRFIIALVAAVMLFTSLSWDGFRIVAEENKTHDVFESTTSQMRVTVTAEKGAFPEGTEMKVKDISQDEALAYARDAMGEENVVNAYAVDITFYLDGEEIQPSDPSKVQVSLKLLKDDVSGETTVLHVEETKTRGSEENVEITTINDLDVAEKSNTVTFESNGFSVYVVVTGDETVTHQRTYQFLNEIDSTGNATAYSFYNKAGVLVDNQVIKNGDILEDVGTPYLTGKRFLGWYLATKNGSTYTYTDTEVQFNTAISGITTDETVYVAPKFEAVYYVTFHENPAGSTEDDVIQTKKVVFISGSDANKVLISDVIAPQPDASHIFNGWTLGTTNYSIYENKQIKTTYIEGITSDVDLYPFFIEAYWLRFVSGETGSRASYVPAIFVETSESIADVPVPTRQGYHFDGWYTGSLDDEGHISYDSQVTDAAGHVINPASGLKLTEETTLYGKWTPNDNSSYTVVIWKQKVTDSKDAADSAKTYDYEAYAVRTGTTGDTCAPSNADISHSYTGFHYARTVQNSTTIRADGSTVINVYYDRDLMAINFYYQDGHQPTGASTAYTYTATTTDGDNLYGVLEDGTYVLLTRTETGTSTRVFYTDSQNGGTEYTGTFYTRNGNRYNETQYNGNNLPPNDNVNYYGREWDWGWSYFRIYRHTETLHSYGYSYTLNGETYNYTGTRYTREQREDYPYMVTWTGLYGQTFGQNNYTWPADIRWNDNRLNQTLLDGFTETDNPYNLYDRGYNGDYYIYHYKQNLDGTTYSEDAAYIARTTSSSGTFNFSNKFEGFTVSTYSNNSEGFQSGGGTHSATAGTSAGVTYPIYIYHTRNKYTITYYSDGVQVHTTGQTVYFETPMSQYNLSLEAVGLSEKPHYQFMGWYADEALTTPYNFNGTMPAANVALYAKWEALWYQIIVDPAGGVITPEIGSTYFWKQYGDTFDAYTIERKYIEDPNGTYKYVYVDGTEDPDGTISVRTATYVPAEAGYTGTKYRPITANDPEYLFVGWYVADENGKPSTEPYDFDAIVEGPVHIVAVWRLEGSYKLQYNPTATIDGEEVSGSFTQSDPDAQFSDGAEITIQPAPTSVLYPWLFDGWEIVDANGNTLSDNDGNYYQPGDEVILNAGAWSSNKLIRLRAHYINLEDSDDPVPITSLVINANGGTLTSLPNVQYTNAAGAAVTVTPTISNNVGTYAKLPLNQKYNLANIQSLVTWEGHVLVGWNHDQAKANNGEIEFKVDDIIGVDNLPDNANTIYAVWAQEVRVVIKGSTFDTSYNGNEQSNTEYTVEYYVGGEKVNSLPDGVTFTLNPASPAAKGTNVGTYKQTVSGTLTSTNEAYIVPEDAVTDGELVLVIDYFMLVIYADTASKDYDGTPLTAGWSIVVNGDPGNPHSAGGHTFTVVMTEDSTITDVGSTHNKIATIDGVEITVEDGKMQPVGNYLIQVSNGTLTVNPKKVTITAKDASKVYDGTALTQPEFEVSGLASTDTHTFTVVMTEDSTITHKGTQPNVIATVDGVEVSADEPTAVGNYLVTIEDGELEITPLEVTITVSAASDEVTYNGKRQTATWEDGNPIRIEASSPLYPMDKVDIFASGGYTPATGIDAGTYTTNIKHHMWMIMHLVSEEEAHYSDFTTKWAFVDGTLVINKAPLKITVIDQIYEYDGNPHGENNAIYTDPEDIEDKVIIEGLQGEDFNEYWKKDILKSITLNGQETAAGVYELTIVPSNGEIEWGHPDPASQYEPLPLNQPIDYNYDVTYVAGTLTITNAELIVKVTGNTDSVVYNGTEQDVNGYTLDCDSTLFDASKVSYGLRATAKGTNVGTYEMGLDASKFSYNDSNITVVFQIVKDGELVITPLAVTVTITGNTASFVYDGDEHEARGYTVTISDPLYKEGDFIAPSLREAVVKATNVGEYTMDIDEEVCENLNDNFTVTFVVNDGLLTITPKEITVNVYGNKETIPYDGQPHTVTGYTVECDDPLYDTRNTVLVRPFGGQPEVTPSATRTEVGKTEMGIHKSIGYGYLITCIPKNKDPNFKVVYEVVDDGYVEITPREYTITVEDKTVPYNGKEQEGNTAYTFGNLAEGHTATVTYTPAKGTDVGTYDNGSFADDVVILDADGNDVTTNYVAGTKTPGKLNIEVLDVTVYITGHKGEYDYNGEEHTVSGYDVSWTAKAWDLDCLAFTGTDSVTETAAGTYPMGLAENQFSNTNPNCNVTFVVEDGELKINKVSINITITGHTGTFPFDNTPHTVEGYDATSTSELFDASKVVCSSDASITETNAGRYDMGLEVSQFSYSDPSVEATFTVKDGWMVISTASVVVTITGHHNTAPYDGTEHSVSGYDVEISDPLYKETDFTFTGTAAAARTDVGTTNMGLTANMFANNNPNFEDVEFIIVDGYQTIEKLAVKVTITGNKDSKVYNGEEQKVEGYEVSISNSLYTEDDFTFSGTDVAKGTNVGTYPMGLAEDQFTNNNGNFDVTFEVVEGELEITKLAVKVTITGNTDSKVYNGEEQKVEGYEVSISNSLYTEDDFTFSGIDVAKGTNVGTYPMGLAEDQFTNNNGNFDVTFEVTDGELKITKLQVRVTIVGNTDSKPYNGGEQKVEGYEVVEITSNLYKESNFTFSGEAVAKGTNVGTYPMGLTEEQFTNNNDNFDVVFRVVDGELEITKLAVTVTITGNKDSKPYNGEEQKVEGYTVSISDPLYTEDDFLCDKKAIAKGTNVGTYSMGLTEDDFGNQNNNFDVTFVVTDGELKITPKEIEVRIFGNNGTFTYDGQPHTVEGYTVECDDKLYDTSNAVLYRPWGSGQPEVIPSATGTDVGTTLMNIHASMTYGPTISCVPKNKDPNFKVTFKVTDGYVEIVPMEVTITAKDAEKVYDGTPLTQPEFTVSELAEGDTHEFTVEMTADSTITNAGTQPNVIATVDGIEVVADKATAVGNYLVTIVDGTLTVTKLPITLRSASDSKEYDGTPLTNDEVTVIGELPKGVTITFDVTGSQTLPGTSENTFTYTISKQRNFLMSLMRMFKAPAKAPSEEDNYDITVEYGTLEVKDRSEKYELEFTAKSDEVTYDGKEHTVEGFTEELTYTNDKGVKYTIEGISASGKGTDAGEYLVAVTGEFKVLDAEGNDVTAQFTLKTNDGKLVINPKEVTVTAKDYTKNVDTEDPTFEADVEGLIGDDKVEYSIKREEGEEVGEYALTPEGEEEQGNYTVKFVAGTLTIVDNVPDTGDRTGIDFWYVTMSLSIIAFLAILVDMKKRRMFA